MHENYSSTCREAIALSRKLAAFRGEAELTPIRLLEGILGTEGCRAHKLLAGLGVNLELVREEIESVSSVATEATASGIPFSRECQAALELAARYQSRFQHDRAGTDHVILGLYLTKAEEMDQLFGRVKIDRAAMANQVQLGRPVSQMFRLGNVLEAIPSARLAPLGALGEKYTDQARLVVREGFALATEYRNGFLAVEHLLLAVVQLAREGRIQTGIFPVRELDLAEIKARIEEILTSVRDMDEGADVDFTLKARGVMELAIQEAYLAGAPAVDADHLVLGLLGLERGIPGEVLRTDLAQARLRLIQKETAAHLDPAPDVHPRLDLSRYRIDRALLHRLPRETAIRCRAVPLSITGRLMTVAMADPSDSEAVVELTSSVSYRIALIQAPVDQIRDIIAQYA